MRGWRWVKTAALLAALIFAATAGAADPFTAMGVLRSSPPPPATAFTLPGIDGKKVSLESVRGKAVLLYFGASW